jgi:hypothetical protein
MAHRTPEIPNKLPDERFSARFRKPMVILTPLKIIQVVFTGLTHQISEYALALATTECQTCQKF